MKLEEAVGESQLLQSVEVKIFPVDERHTIKNRRLSPDPVCRRLTSVVLKTLRSPVVCVFLGAAVWEAADILTA